MSKKWTEKEEKKLKKLYSKEVSIDEISNKLNRSYSSVSNKAFKLDITDNMTRRKWKETEETFLKENYNDAPVKEISKELNRSCGSVRRKAYELRLKKEISHRKYFKQEELDKNLCINETTCSYLAGLTDSDGSITLSKRANRERYDPRLIILNNTVENFVNEVEGYIPNDVSYYINEGTTPNGEKKTYSIVISGMVDIYRLLSKIKPYLNLKGKLADLVMEFIEVRASKYHGEGYGEKEKQIADKIKKSQNRA